MSNLFTELKRRKVFRVATAYAVVCWLTIQVVGSITGPLNLPEWVPTIVIVFLGIGFPVALIFAWAFELTPDGVKKTADVEADATITQSTSRKIDFIIIGALVFTIGGMAYERMSLSPPDPSNALKEISTKSIAVLPFVNMSDNKDQEWFSDGLTEEILNSLAMLPELAVTARTSSFHFKGQNLPVNEIADKLNVEYIVEGSVRRGGDTLRITAQLIRAGEDSHMWSKTYDQPADNVLDVQLAVAEAIAVALDIYMDEERREAMFSSGTRNVEAFEAYLKALAIDDQAHKQEKDADLWTSTAYYEKAIEADPKFSTAYQRIQDAYTHYILGDPNDMFLGGRHPEGLTQEIALKKLRAYQTKALELANTPYRKVVAELAIVVQSQNWRTIPRILDSIRKEPAKIGKAVGTTWFFESMALFGESPIIIPLLKDRTARDKYDLASWIYLADAYAAAGEFDKAMKTAEQSTTYGYGGAYAITKLKYRQGDRSVLIADQAAYQARGEDVPLPIYHALGQEDKAVEIVKSALETDPHTNSMLKLQYYFWSGQQDKADAVASEIDKAPLGVLEFAQIIQMYGSVHVNRAAVPNLVRKYIEAGLSEEKINQLIHIPNWESTE